MPVYMVQYRNIYIYTFKRILLAERKRDNCKQKESEGNSGGKEKYINASRQKERDLQEDWK